MRGRAPSPPHAIFSMNTQPVDITLELSSEFQSYTWMRALIELPVKPLSSANIIPGDPRAPAPFPSALVSNVRAPCVRDVEGQAR